MVCADAFNDWTGGRGYMAKHGQLKAYRKKRDFGRTDEPRGTKGRQSAGRLIFVVQKHKATQLHYDFRIQVGRVLKSWAVPRGPSMNPKEKRLAVPTEDHPREYAKFEGTIPKGQYGGGTVMVWDIGRYTNLKKRHGRTVSMRRAVKDGQVEIKLRGKKLTGAYALIRTSTEGRRERWLLIKMKDEAANARRNPVRTEPNSALTNRSMSEISRDAKRKGR